jgi:hypothetical protein
MTTAASTSCPAFSGLFAPYWRSEARGVIAGLTPLRQQGHIARAVLEATAWQTREVLDAMNADSGVELTALKVDGGMVLHETLMQFQSDVLGVPVNPAEGRRDDRARGGLRGRPRGRVLEGNRRPSRELGEGQGVDPEARSGQAGPRVQDVEEGCDPDVRLGRGRGARARPRVRRPAPTSALDDGPRRRGGAVGSLVGWALASGGRDVAIVRRGLASASRTAQLTVVEPDREERTASVTEVPDRGPAEAPEVSSSRSSSSTSRPRRCHARRGPTP